MSNKIVELMQVAPEEHYLAWLQESLQAAVELEFATLPPYLSGAWSIKNRSAPANAVAYNLILSVALEEMLHMGWRATCSWPSAARLPSQRRPIPARCRAACDRDSRCTSAA